MLASISVIPIFACSGLTFTAALTNGTINSIFGNAGKVVSAFSNRDDAVNAVMLQPDAKLMLASNYRSETCDKFCPACYDSVVTCITFPINAQRKVSMKTRGH